MAFTKWGYIYLGTGTEDPTTDRAVIERGGLTTTIVAVPDSAAAVAVAKELVSDGAQTIELCGGFGAKVVADVIEATGGTIPVGAVSYGPQAIPGLHALFHQPAS